MQLMHFTSSDRNVPACWKVNLGLNMVVELVVEMVDGSRSSSSIDVDDRRGLIGFSEFQEVKKRTAVGRF